MFERKKNLKSLEKDEFSARKALSSCVPIFPPPPPPSLAFRETVAIKIVRNDSIYIHIKIKRRRYTVTKTATDNQTANCNHPSALDSYIYF